MFDEIEETVAANTLGTIIHNTLEELYKPTLNRFLNEADIKNAFPLIEPIIKKYFKKLFKNGDFSTGKNLIVFEIVKKRPYYKNTCLRRKCFKNTQYS